MYLCKICGRQLEAKGDICTDCYEGLLEEEENQKDDKVLYTIKAQYKLGYEIMKTPFMFFLITVLIISLIVTSFQSNIVVGILYSFISIGGFFLYFLLKKIRIESRVIELYKYKLVYTRKLHFKNRYEAKYRNIEEIQFQDIDKKTSLLSQSSWWLHRVNKKYKMTELYFKIKQSENTVFGIGFFIKPVHNFKEDIMPKLMDIIGLTENTEERRTAIEEMLNIKKKNKDKDEDKDKDNNDENENTKNNSNNKRKIKL